MQRKFLINLLIVSLGGIMLATAALYVIQTVMAHHMAKEVSLAKLEEVTERIRQNDLKIEELTSALKEDYLSRARAFALMIELDSDIIKDRNKLNEVAAALNVDELHVIDENGILWWGTQPQYYGMDFATTDQTRPFLAILENPSLEFAQDLMPNGSGAVVRQYAGVSLLNKKGVAQVGMVPERLEEALKNNKICNVLGSITVGNTGYVFSVLTATGAISSHKNQELIGTLLPSPLQNTGFMTIDGQNVLYHTKNIKDHILVAAIPTAELYSQRTSYTIIFMCFMILVFGASGGITNRYIKRDIISGISRTVSTLEKISTGNLDVTAEVRSSKEFEKLSDGINHMLFNIKAKMDEIAAMTDNLKRLGTIIASSNLGVIIKDMEGVITAWNMGAQKILGYGREEMLGCTSDEYASVGQTDKFKEVNRRLLEGESINHMEMRVVHKDGGLVICSASFSPTFNSNNEITGSVVIFQNITAEKMAEQKAQRLAAIFAVADAGIIVKNKDGIVQEWNIGAKNILGYKPEETIGKSTKYYAPKEAHAGIDEIEARLRKGEHITHTEVIRKNKDNCLVVCSASYTPIFDNAAFAGSIAIFHDISDKKRIEEALTDAVLAAEEASRLKTAFLANMSHEIRTPMNGIIGFAELAVESGGLQEKTKDYLNKIRVSAEGLLQIINDILDISKIESGKVELEKIPFDLRDTLKNCEELSILRANEKGIKLHFYTEPYIGKKIVGDSTKLRQVLLNLLSNAIKFTNYGMVKFIALIEETTETSVKIHFEVKDSGIGMTAEQIQKIFDPFIQADTSTTRKYGGTGLGLSITKNFIELMGGELKVESTYGLGSNFSFDLTFEIIDEFAAIQNKEDAKINYLKKPVFNSEVLVCEDNVINQQVIQEHLLKVGINPEIAPNGQIGVDMAKARMAAGKPFDLILMDIHMPVMDGLEAAKKLLELGVKTPIVALTANIMHQDKKIYQEHGMPVCLGKPFKAQELWACLFKYLMPVKLINITGNTGNSFAAGFSQENSDSTEDVIINRQLGIEQVDGNEKLYDRLLVKFVKDNKATFQELNEAIETGDIKLAHRMAHTLKNLAGMIGVTRLAGVALVIENSLSAGKIMAAKKQMQTLEIELNSVLDELGPLAEEPEKTLRQIGALDREKTLELINKLEPLLESGNVASLELLPEIKEILSPIGEKSDILITQIDEYDFELAVETLSSIRQWMEC